MEMNQTNFNLLYDQLTKVVQENTEHKSNIEQLKLNLSTAMQAQETLHEQSKILKEELFKTANIIENLNKTGTDKQHVQRVNLLKSKEPTSFTNKSNYSVWAEGIKADLVPVLPELKQFSNLLSPLNSLIKIW